MFLGRVQYGISLLVRLSKLPQLILYLDVHMLAFIHPIHLILSVQDGENLNLNGCTYNI